MTSRVALFLIFSLMVCLLSSAPAQEKAKPAEEKPLPTELPKVTGDWIGTWGTLLMPTEPGKKPEKNVECKSLECKVVLKDGVWQATFEGECGRPYKYTIKMEGRQNGDAVLFKGTTDLGSKDGGSFDWIGRATEQEFVGFYTSAKSAGTFSLSRKK